MKQEDIDKAIMAYRYSCTYSSLLKHFDGTKEPYNCWEFNSAKHGYKCRGYMCKNLRTFVNILKEPTQDSLPDFKEH
jgi:hypothetical protein